MGAEDNGGLVTFSERGFPQTEPIECDYGNVVNVRGSSAASAPHIWLDVTPVRVPPDDRDQSVAAHLSLNQARRLRDLLDALIDYHEQVARDYPGFYLDYPPEGE